MTRAILTLNLCLALPSMVYAEAPRELNPKTYGGTLLELTAPQVLPVVGSRLNVKFKTAVLRNKNGDVLAGVLAANTTLGVLGDNLNVTFKGGTIAAFSPGHDESKPGVHQGVLAETRSLNTFRNDAVIAIKFQTGTKLGFYFYPNHGNRTLAALVR